MDLLPEGSQASVVLAGAGVQGVGLQLSDPQQAQSTVWFVLQSLISSWKNEPKLQKQFQTCPLPQRRPPLQPQTLRTGRSQSGLRMHSLPCEPSCGLPRPGRSLLTLPVDTGHWPLPQPAYLYLHGNATVFAPRPPWSGPALPSSLWVATAALTRGPALRLPEGSRGLRSSQEEPVAQCRAG